MAWTFRGDVMNKAGMVLRSSAAPKNVEIKCMNEAVGAFVKNHKGFPSLVKTQSWWRSSRRRSESGARAFSCRAANAHSAFPMVYKSLIVTSTSRRLWTLPKLVNASSNSDLIRLVLASILQGNDRGCKLSLHYHFLRISSC